MGLCERCKKAQATYHETNIDTKGEKSERHLCDECAREEGKIGAGKVSVDLNELLESFIAGGKGGAPELASLVCEHCGLSYIEFRNRGVLGCPHDYDAFREPLARLLERTHGGGAQHVGKLPRAEGGDRKPHEDIRRLKRQLNEAVSGEDYERAARLRDRIRELEGA